MSCSKKAIRRRLLLVVSAVVASVAVTATAAVAATASTTTLVVSSAHGVAALSTDDDEVMIPTFSCGTKWQSAKQCSQLCMNGEDSSCPIGQHCYAAIPCSKKAVEESTILQLENMLMEQLIQERDRNSVKAFVCGISFQEAESACGSSKGGAPIRYCHSGQSSECPSDMECFASVACSTTSSSSSATLLSTLPPSSSSSSQQKQPIISFSSTPTANNVTPIIIPDDDASKASAFSFSSLSVLLKKNNIFVTTMMGSYSSQKN